MNYENDIDDDDTEADEDAAFHPTENERFPGIFLSPQDYADAFAIRTAKAKVGRPSERFYLRWPHPLADTHVIVRKAKTDILALAGHGPPKYSDDPAKKEQFCLYYASNYKPWIFHQKSPRPDVSVPAFVDYYRRIERGACLYGPRERDPDPKDSAEAAFQQKCAYRARCIAAGRLFTINTAVSALETDSAVAAMTRAIRARSRDLWEHKKKPEEEKARTTAPVALSCANYGKCKSTRTACKTHRPLARACKGPSRFKLLGTPSTKTYRRSATRATSARRWFRRSSSRGPFVVPSKHDNAASIRDASTQRTPPPLSRP